MKRRYVIIDRMQIHKMNKPETPLCEQRLEENLEKNKG